MLSDGEAAPRWPGDAARPIGRTADLRDGRFAFEVTSGEPFVAVAGPGGLCVIDGECPHQYFPLIRADIDDRGVVTCPMHGWRFELATGRGIDVPQVSLRRWPAEIRGDHVFVVAQPKEPPR